MPRSPDGTYNLPNADVAPGDEVSSAWANSTMNDIADALTDSLDRDGNGGMRAPLLFGDGSAAAPGVSYIAEPSSGMFRAATGDIRISVLGSELFRWSGGKAQVWVNAAWADVLYESGPGTIGDGTANNQVPLWNNTNGTWEAGTLAALNVSYDPTGNASISGTTVQAALDSADGSIASLNTHVSDTSIHWDDAPVDGVTYNRRDGTWVQSVAGISDHSALNGLTVGDDHPQYLNNTRGDARYYLSGAKVNDSSLWDGYTIEVTATPGTDPNTIYFIPV